MTVFCTSSSAVTTTPSKAKAWRGVKGFHRFIKVSTTWTSGWQLSKIWIRFFGNWISLIINFNEAFNHFVLEKYTYWQLTYWLVDSVEPPSEQDSYIFLFVSKTNDLCCLCCYFFFCWIQSLLHLRHLIEKIKCQRC